MTHKFRFRGSDALAAALVVCLATSWAFGQSGSRSETGVAADDLQLAGPANNQRGPAPAAKIDIPDVDDAIAKGAAGAQDIDSFIAGDPPAIVDPDPQRQGKAAPDTDLSPTPTVEEEPTQPSDDVEPPVVAKSAGAQQNAAAPALPMESHGTQSDNAQGDVAKLQERVARLEMLIEAQSAMLEDMKTVQAQMMPTEELKAIREEIVALRNSFQMVARPDFDGGAVGNQTPAPEVGILVVENLTGFGYTMNVNGYDINVLPGRQEFPIEIGKIVTELRGFEAPRAWSPENFQDVNGQRQLAIQIR